MIQGKEVDFSRLLDRVLSGFSIVLNEEEELTGDIEEDDWCIVGNSAFFDSIRETKNRNGKSVYESIKQILPYMDFQEGSCDMPECKFAIALLRHRRELGNKILSEKTRII